MRKVNIGKYGDVADDTGLIECPYRGRGEKSVNCRTHCAWFRVVDKRSQQLRVNYPVAYCGDKCIGAIGETK